jgi:transcriptional regulator
MHGYGIGRWIERTSDDALTVEEGSLYPALHRMEKRGWIAPEWRQTENNRRAKYYALTADGRRQLDAQTQRWSLLVASVGRVLQAAVP